jgi:hypothetical protein
MHSANMKKTIVCYIYFLASAPSKKAISLYTAERIVKQKIILSLYRAEQIADSGEKVLNNIKFSFSKFLSNKIYDNHVILEPAV